jgi:hypothetical protein
MKHKLAIVMEALCACSLLACAPACTCTVTPQPVVPTEAGFDGDTQDSGIVRCLRDARGAVVGWVVTARARDHYNALLDKYGAVMWLPPAGRDYGVCERADGMFDMSDEAMTMFVAMSQRARMDAGAKAQ